MEIFPAATSAAPMATAVESLESLKRSRSRRPRISEASVGPASSRITGSITWLRSAPIRLPPPVMRMA